MPDLFSTALSIAGSIIPGHRPPKTIDVNLEPYLTRWRYYRWTVGLSDYESTVVVWAENGQVLYDDELAVLKTAQAKLNALNVPVPNTAPADVAGGNNPPPQPKNALPSGVGAEVAKAEVGGIPMTFLLLAGGITAVALVARK